MTNMKTLSKTLRYLPHTQMYDIELSGFDINLRVDILD